MRRRELAGLALLPWVDARAAGDEAFPRAVRQGGCAVVFRHAQTVAGIGDPPGFALASCATQRNLNDEGRAQARRIGEWFASHGLRPAAVRSSAWCRCQDTARLAFGASDVWAPLNSTFDDAALSPAATARLREALRAIPATGFEVWVTHQVNITALTGRFAASGEGFVVDAAGAVRAQARL
ncbi:histidine phosphatase family protein [Comamonadaceae bacterium OTU4NAUVB1]|jgi:phosphohistidine phosphatase SixA|nr:histidine phosphatase family protein [Comamonadaceae bacterium OTU4NAUVB1]